MSVFDLATTSRRALDEEAERNALRLEDLPLPAWEGGTEALKGLLRPAAATARGAALLGAAPVVAIDEAREGVRAAGDAFHALGSAARGGQPYMPDRAPITGAQDWYFRNVVDDIGSNAVDYWTPDPESMGSAAKAINVGSNVAGTIPFLFGTPSLFLAQSGADPAVELVRQGVDAETAGTVGAINLAANAIGLRIPAAWGTTLTQRIASGTASNLGLGVAVDAASAGALEVAGYEQQAEGFDAADPYARALDLLMGAAFGYKAHVDAPRLMSQSQRDAVLTTRNNDHLHRQTLPGEPATPRAAKAHATALSDAIGQVLRGEQVNVADTINPADFVLRPELQAAPAAVDYVSYRRTLESGNRPTAKASTSSAYGIDQFTAGTWRRVVAQERPAWADGLSDAELLAQRANPERSGEMATALDRANTVALEAAGEAPSAHNLYAMHHFGEAGGVKFAQAGDSARMETILTKQQIDANPYLRGKTKAEAIAGWDERARRNGVEVPMRGTAGEPDTVDAPAPRRFDGPEAGRIIDQRLATLDDLALQERLSGGEVAALEVEDAELVATLRRSERIARDGVVPADPRARLTPEQVQGASARRVEIRRVLERNRAAVDYERQADQLRRRLERIDADADLIQLAERLAGFDAGQAGRVTPDASPAQRTTGDGAPARAADAGQGLGAPAARGSAAFGEGSLDLRADQPAARSLPGAVRAAVSRLVRGPVTAPEAPQHVQEGDAATGAPAVGDAASARPVRRDAAVLDEALRAATENPGLQVVDGFDGDGNPRYRPASEVLAEIEAEHARALSDAQAFPAAVSCFLRMGT